MGNKVIFTFLLCFISLFEVQSQTTGTFRDNPIGTNATDPDSLTAKDSIIVKNAFFKIFKGKPGRAALYSLVLPGAGQLYNRKYWKVPLAWAIDGGLIYNVYYQTSQYNYYNSLYLQELNSGGSNVLRYRANRDTYRKAKEFSWLYLVAGHILTTLDAYVDRHLMEFDISPDLSLVQIPGQTTIALGIQIPLHHINKSGKTF